LALGGTEKHWQGQAAMCEWQAAWGTTNCHFDSQCQLLLLIVAESRTAS